MQGLFERGVSAFSKVQGLTCPLYCGGSCLPLPKGTVLKRPGGLLLAAPSQFFDEGLLAFSQSVPASEVLGPSEFFECAAATVADGGLVEHGARISCLVVDCNEAICASLRLAEHVLPEAVEPFLPEDPSLIPISRACCAGGLMATGRRKGGVLLTGRGGRASAPSTSKEQGRDKSKSQSKANTGPKEDVCCGNCRKTGVSVGSPACLPKPKQAHGKTESFGGSGARSSSLKSSAAPATAWPHRKGKRGACAERRNR